MAREDSAAGAGSSASSEAKAMRPIPIPHAERKRRRAKGSCRLSVPGCRLNPAPADEPTGSRERPDSLKSFTKYLRASVHNRFRDWDGDGNQLPPAGETACPTYFAKRLIQQGGAGGFACRSNGTINGRHLSEQI